jgi:hypothetical protein
MKDLIADLEQAVRALLATIETANSAIGRAANAIDNANDAIDNATKILTSEGVKADE